MKYFLLLSICFVSAGSLAQTADQVDSLGKAGKYIFTGKLVEQVPLPPACGMFAWALVHKFEVLKTDYPGYNNQYVLIIQPCPEFMGQRFFRKKQTYQIHVAANSGVAFGYSIVNKYEKEQLPIFWCRQITWRK